MTKRKPATLLAALASEARDRGLPTDTPDGEVRLTLPDGRVVAITVADNEDMGRQFEAAIYWPANSPHGRDQHAAHLSGSADFERVQGATWPDDTEPGLLLDELAVLPEPPPTAEDIASGRRPAEGWQTGLAVEQPG